MIQHLELVVMRWWMVLLSWRMEREREADPEACLQTVKHVPDNLREATLTGPEPDQNLQKLYHKLEGMS